ncbi:hypothetical protein Lal_00039554 [Lupinus albus]|nr:hypothetical protein Lal_00039554 [Lupinus albus]
MAKTRNSIKSLTMLRDEDDVLLDQEGIANLALGYFTDLYASNNLALILIHNVIPAMASARKIHNVSSWLGFWHGMLPFTYLGVPVFKGKPRFVHLQPIADRILGKLSKWKGFSLSITRRVELVKSIVHSMLLFSFYVYHWPKKLLKQLDCGIRNFIWSVDVNTKKLVTVAWHQVCNPIKEGGLGMRSISAINHAALLKLRWEMLSSSQDWAIFFRHRFIGASRPSTSHLKSSILPSIKINWYGANYEIGLFFINPKGNQLNWCKLIWSKSIPQYKSLLTWRLFLNKLPIDENIKRRGISLTSVCNLCLVEEETSNHIFLHCNFAISIWQWLR